MPHHLGTLRWLPPEDLATGTREQGGGRGRGSGKTDVWSLGCVLLELATCGLMDVRVTPQSLLVVYRMQKCSAPQGSHYSVLIQRLHRDPSVLQEAMERVGKVYICYLLKHYRQTSYAYQ